MIKERLNLVRYFLKNKKGMTVQSVVISIIIAVAVLVIAGLIYGAISGKLSFFGDKLKNWLRFGA